MKKLIFAAMAVLGLSAAGFAQTNTQAKKASPAKMQVSTKAVSSTAPQAKATVVHKTTAAATTKAPAKQAAAKTVAKNSATPVKKDGTPDKRYKANKRLAKVHHLKKDGTADKRFKENKKPS